MTLQANAEWEFMLASANTGKNLGPAETFDWRLTTGINAIDQCSGSLPLISRYAAILKDTDNVLLKVYQAKQLRFTGPITSAQEVSAQADKPAVITFNAQSGLWYFTKRLIGKFSTGFSSGSALSQVDRGTLIQQVMAYADGDPQFAPSMGASGPPTGVDAGAFGYSSDGFVGPWFYKPCWEAIQELALTLGGPDVIYRPREPVFETKYGVNTLKLGYLDTVGSLGGQQPRAIFEYGPRGMHNIAGYTHIYDSQFICNRLFSVGTPNDASQGVIEAEDTAAQAARKLYEDRLESDLVVDEMRTELAAEHIEIRKIPREIVSFSPTRARLGQYQPLLWRDFDIGDEIPVRIEEGGEVTFNAWMRLYSAEFAHSTEDNAVRPTYVVAPV